MVDWGEIEIAPELGGVRMQQGTGTFWRIRRIGGPRGERPPASLVLPVNLLQSLLPMIVLVGGVAIGLTWLAKRTLAALRR